MNELSCDVETFKKLEAKTESIIQAVTKNYIADGYHVKSYENNEYLGFIEVYLSNIKNEIRIVSMILNREIEVYKNKKFNNRIEVSA